MIKKFDKKDEESGPLLTAGRGKEEEEEAAGSGLGGVSLRGANIRRAGRVWPETVVRGAGNGL